MSVILADARTAMFRAILFGLLTLIVMGATVIWLSRTIALPLKSIADDLRAAAGQVEQASHQMQFSSQALANGSQQQAASLEETSSSLEELSTMTRQNAENTHKANALAKQAREAADKGANDIQTMNAAMAAIKTSSDDIAKIIKTIDEIAFQTNILALNAAVEAARAGEAGMGFAVVADEVRNLAQRSAQAARETTSKIEGAIQKTAQGVEISRKVAAALNDIVTKARQVDELVAEVSAASGEQDRGITQINAAVAQMGQVTSSNSTRAEESANGAEQLSSQAVVLNHSVTELLQLLGGGDQQATPELAKPAAESGAGFSTARRGDGLRSYLAKPQLAGRRSDIPLDDSFTES